MPAERSAPRRHAVGAGAKYRLVFVDRLLATLVHLRHATTHDVLAAWFGVDRSTITRAVNEVRPLLADRGCRIESGVRLRTVADVVAYLDHTKLTGLMDATEIRVRRPARKRGGRKRFISGQVPSARGESPDHQRRRLPRTRPAHVRPGHHANTKASQETSREHARHC